MLASYLVRQNTTCVSDGFAITAYLAYGRVNHTLGFCVVEAVEGVVAVSMTIAFWISTIELKQPVHKVAVCNQIFMFLPVPFVIGKMSSKHAWWHKFICIFKILKNSSRH